MKPIGPTFSTELEKSGLNTLAVSWCDDGTLNFGDGVSAEQRRAVEAIYDAHDPLKAVVPTVVEMRQARLALLGAGLLDTVESAIAGMTGPEGRAAQIEWEYALTLRRDHPLTAALAGSLGLSEQALDALFTQAATL